ncbi:MAG: dipicolinate synthase subunit B [Thermoanaerobacteraceae bacterium]|nr:dipicolinate synthase subunit B [Thermoanaerobacteraceae bacterium]
MDVVDLRIGFALTGSYCTFDKVLPEIEKLVSKGTDVTAILSENTSKTDTRFGKADELIEKLIAITGKKPIMSIVDAEPIGPKKLFDCIVVAPCTGNTLAKLANAITDTTVLMACKAHMRNNRPVVIGVSTNDGLGINAINLGRLLNVRNIYFVPFAQDDPLAKPRSIVSKMELIEATIIEALNGRQLQPIIMAR